MKKVLFWILAVIITLASAVYQRMTGPTVDVKGKVEVAGTEIPFELPRSAENQEDCPIRLSVPEPIEGYLEYKRYKTDDPWTQVPLIRQNGDLVGFLPRQPAAGKLVYDVVLMEDEKLVRATGEKPVVIRFKDPVPIWLIIPHVFVIFMAMLFSTRGGLAALNKKEEPKPFVWWTLGFLLVGGFILGPLVQKFAFGVLWSGFPFGIDLTDNKTLISLIFWIAAAVANRKGKSARGWILTASIVTLIIFLIPHSLLGSELDYSQM